MMAMEACVKAATSYRFAVQQAELEASNVDELLLATREAAIIKNGEEDNSGIPLQWKRAGVIVSGIVPESELQTNFLDIPPVLKQKLTKLSQVADAINRKHGDEVIQVAKALRSTDLETGKALTFRNSILHDRRSPFYTTDIRDIIEVK
jgi:hypothetical protein